MLPGAVRWLVGCVVAVGVALFALTTVLDAWLVGNGYGDQVDTVFEPFIWPLVAGFVASGTVGAVVALRQPRNPVGWLFLGLAGAIILSALIDSWYTFALVVSPSRVGGGDLAGAIGDKTFIPWFTLVTLILLLTPTGTYPSARWRVVGRVAVVAAVAATFFSFLRGAPLEDYPLAENPFAAPVLEPAVGLLAFAALILAAGCLLAGGVSLVLRFRDAGGDARRQLLWLALVVVPLPAFVSLAFVAAYADLDALKIAATGGFVTLVPIAAGLSVLRYRLYDVDRVVSTTTTYSVLSLLLVVVYGTVVWTGSRIAWSGGPSDDTTAAIGAVAAAILFAPLRSGVQQRVDRRFNRRAYEAARVVRTALAESRAGLDPEELLRSALADPALRVAYAGVEGPVDGRGHAVAPFDDEVEIRRDDRTVAWVGYDPARNEPATVSRVGALAAAELDNTRLRADLQRHLAELARSRSRIADAQREERRRIERDLHDGAQQTLLALAFDLQSAQLNGDPERMRCALTGGATAARDAARQLRDLANGLHPQALVEGGLDAVLDDLARHSPVPLRVSAPRERWEPTVEFTAWLVVAEAVVNAQKHAEAQRIDVLVRRDRDVLRLRVEDDGRGGADETSSGLRGLRDRVEAAGGAVTIESSPGVGTAIEAVIPCGS